MATWTEKLHRSNDLPKIVEITGRMSRSWGEGSCVVPAPIEVDHLMRQVKRGRVITSHELRQALAGYHQTDLACPLTTGIFCWIARACRRGSGGAGRATHDSLVADAQVRRGAEPQVPRWSGATTRSAGKRGAHDHREGKAAVRGRV